MIAKSEEQIVLLRRYDMKKVSNQYVVYPPVSAIQQCDIESMRLSRLSTDYTLIIATSRFIHQYFGTAEVTFQARSRRNLLARDLVTWKATYVRHILEGIAGRAT
ncbi:hypothetical protein TNCV_3271271 [Trichonephila clavipes]|nr:hypothetical protein TNCV_3271271 [Trichonephila clavipes]